MTLHTEPLQTISTRGPVLTRVEVVALLGVAVWLAGCCTPIGATLY